MNAQTVEAVFESGAFRLVTPLDLGLAEGQKVKLMVEPVETPEDILKLAAEVYDGLTVEQVVEIESHIHRRSDFFGERLVG